MNRQRQSQQQSPHIDVKSIITDPSQKGAQTLVNTAEELGPKMAYRARRERGQGVERLRQVLDEAINEVLAAPDEKEKNQRFQRFVEFFEAILAYHKAYGGN